ncbi:MAG: flagellin [Oscillibacter sp.]|nr:flagellin [Oscillibacter sp.]
MRVQHNIPAMNSYRNYNNNAKAINKNLEKLSSGYRINRAGDDAAGLAISEKMRAQITGLEVAQKNAKDGISLVQTAEGALTEVHSMLNRMYALAEQAGNGTYDNSVDRVQLNKEVNKLRDEINRIGNTTNFNGTKLFTSESGLSGVASFADANGKAVSVGVVASFSTEETSLDNTELDVTAGVANGKKVFQLTAANGYKWESADSSVTIGGTGDVTAQVVDASGNVSLTMVNTSDNTKTMTIKLDMSNFNPPETAVDAKMKISSTHTAPTEPTAQGNTPTNVSLSSNGIDLWVGDFPDSNNKINVQLGEISDKKLVIDDAHVNLASQASALDSLSYIKDAIDYVSDMRGTLGAAQNRLEHTINNLSVMQENIQDAESTIRDTDVAEEMMKYTKNSILVQSAQAMLAQANQQPQSVLQLLQ